LKGVPFVLEAVVSFERLGDDRGTPEDECVFYGHFFQDFGSAMRQLQRLTITAQQLASQALQAEPIASIGQTIPLTDEQQHYLVRVLRLASGDRFLAIFPNGTTWLAQIQPEATHFELLESHTVQSELPIGITLVLSLPKGSGFDDVVRQVTELGVTRIIPVISDRTVLKPSANRHDRWQRIAAEATEQSERSVTPIVEAPLSFDQYLKTLTANNLPAGDPPPTPFLRCPQGLYSGGFDFYYFCWGRGDSLHLLEQLQQDLVEESNSSRSITIAIGPEGGWTDGEVDRAIKAGFVPVSLGKRILRAITAPAAAMAIVGAFLESPQAENCAE
jgi:16S rRNA (uracil1498-N3)-methyltransferase